GLSLGGDAISCTRWSLDGPHARQLRSCPTDPVVEPQLSGGNLFGTLLVGQFRQIRDALANLAQTPFDPVAQIAQHIHAEPLPGRHLRWGELFSGFVEERVHGVAPSRSATMA